MMKIIAIICLILGNYSHLHAQSLDPGKKIVSAVYDSYLEYLVDESGEMDWDSAKKEEFFPLPNGDTNFGFTDKAHWFRLRLEWLHPAQDDYYLVLDYPLLDQVDFYAWNGIELTTLSSGDQLSFSKRSSPFRQINFRMNEGYHPTTIWLRVKTTSSLQVGGRLATETSTKSNIALENAILSTYYGAMIVIMVYNFFIFFFLEDRVYLIYAFYLGAYIFFQSNLNGVSFALVFPDFPYIFGIALVPSFFLAMSIAFLFSGKFLQTHSRPILNRWIQYYIGFLLLLGMVSLWLPYSIAVKLMVLFALLGPIVLLSLGVRRLLDGYKPAKYFLTAWTFFILGMLLYPLKSIALIPSNLFTEYAMQIGSLMEAILLSIGLAYRFHLIRLENREIEKKLKEKSNELEKKVRDRTEELESVVRNLNTTKQSLIENEKKSALTDLALGFSRELEKPIQSLAMAIPYCKEEAKNIQQLVEELTASDDSPEGRDFRKSIYDRLDRFTAIYQDMEYGLKRSRVILEELNEMNDMEKKPTSLVRLRKISLQELIQIRKIYYPTIGSEPVKIQVHSRIDPHIQTIPLTLIRILHALYRNAFYFASQSRREDYSPIVRVELEPGTKDRSYLFRIANNGDPIPASLETKIFEMFFTTKPIGVGKGTGLTLASRLAENLGGRVYLSDRGEVSGWVEFCLEISDLSRDLSEEYEPLSPTRGVSR